MSAAVDVELCLKEEQEFLFHLAECVGCREEFEDAKKIKLIIRERIIKFKAPQTLVNSIMQLTCFSNEEAEENMSFG